MGFMSEIDEDLENARILENQKCSCTNSDACVKCCERRIKIAELKGETPDIHDMMFLKMSGKD